jgi:hypothetical protein
MKKPRRSAASRLPMVGAGGLEPLASTRSIRRKRLCAKHVTKETLSWRPLVKRKIEKNLSEGELKV